MNEVDTAGRWLAVYSRHGQLCTELADTEQDALDFLRSGEDAGEHSVISLHGPGANWDEARLRRHFCEVYERDHAEEITAEKQRAEAAKQAHREWLAKQPAWRVHHLDDAEITRDRDAYRVVLDGQELPFIVSNVTWERSGATSEIVLRIPLSTDVRVTQEIGHGQDGDNTIRITPGKQRRPGTPERWTRV